ncbi:SDR family oxidoreductase [Tsukamurella sp. USMM236]|uniref:SDR family oxidoreductase n=1 Tax=Tsukamurella sp. USMM236 TaxID=3081301 RepID=UPI003018D91A
MILVTGATGVVGRRVVAQLAANGASVRATSRTPDAADLPDGIETLSSSAPAHVLVDGCSSVLIIASALGAAQQDRLAELVAAANAAQVGRLVHLSTASVTDPLSPTGAHHRALEEVSSGFAGARRVLRPVPFALNTLHWWGPTVRAGRFAEAPYLDVPMVPVDERDVADVATALLLGTPEPDGPLHLTGPEALSSREQLGLLAEALSTPLDVREIEPDEVRRRLAAVGVPTPAVESLLRSFEVAAERPVAPNGVVERIIGRSARSYGQWVVDHVEQFR